MSLFATARSIDGTLRQEVVIDGRHRLVTDEPEAVGGEGSGPAPHELLAAAVASCIGTTVVMYARRRDWDLRCVNVAVEYDHRATPRHCDVMVELTGELDDAQRERLEAVAEACPVRRALETGFEFDEHLVVRPAAADSRAG